ncbi:hypothetical protein COO91_08724 [Nostoc flagelliforme CCNUN1]|uniref:Uncharacterized protein n=1 Tax=Nostoc flagelliforme CCNUN1 TaxID=2038116 RepID=A0A2K8T4E5_9NOSO|nr:hypothetical protein COO91_08724 [Nostoc flagelliforme CCNUN1]
MSYKLGHGALGMGHWAWGMVINSCPSLPHLAHSPSTK